MRILIDCYQLIKGKGKSIGIYNYSVNLLTELIPLIVKENEVYIINNSINYNDFKFDKVKNVVINKIPEGIITKIKWELLDTRKYIKRNKIDIYFSPRGFLPPKVMNCKMITTVHDLIPLYYQRKYLKYINVIENIYIVKRLKRTCKRADSIITVSKYSKKQIIDNVGISSEKIHVIYNGLNKNMEMVEPKNCNKSEKYIFAISSKLKHKNLVGLLNAYDRYVTLCKDPVKLKICGARNCEKYLDDLSLKAKKNIELLPYLTDNELNWYYYNANVFIFLSHIEGFGFPIIEALKFSTPVICSDIECFREILKEINNVTFVNQNDSNEVAKAILNNVGTPKCVFDCDYIFEKYDWKRNAEEVEKLFKNT